jgi:hypothetical protein
MGMLTQTHHNPGSAESSTGSNDNYVADSIKLSPELIQTWVKENYFNPRGYQHWNWDRKLWSRPYDEIVAFLEERFRKTLDETEYYHLMVYLRKVIPDSELFIPFRESPQHQKEFGTFLPTSSNNSPIRSQHIAKTHWNFTVKGVKNHAR